MRHLLHTNLYIGLIAVSFILGTYALVGLPVSVPLLLLGFCGAFLVYHIERGWGWAPEDMYNHPDRVSWMRAHRGYFWGAIGAACVFSVLAFPALRPETFGWCVALGAVSLFYMAPLLPGGRRGKSVWFLKPLFISSGWAVGGVLLPAVQAGAAITWTTLAFATYRFLFILPNAVIADVPDREGDARVGLQTAATMLSERAIRLLAAGSLILALAIGLGLAFHQRVRILFLIDLIGPLMMLAATLRPYAASRWLNGAGIDLIVAWPAVTALAAWWMGKW